MTRHYKMHGSTPKGRSRYYTYYLTTDKIEGVHKSVATGGVDEQVVELLDGLTVDPQSLPRLRKLYEEHVQILRGPSASERIAELEERIERMYQEEAALARLYAQGKLNDRNHQLLHREWQDKTAALRQEIVNLEAETAEILDGLDEAVMLLTRMPELFHRLKLRQQNRLLRILFRRIIIDTQGTVVDFDLNPPFAYLSSLKGAPPDSPPLGPEKGLKKWVGSTRRIQRLPGMAPTRYYHSGADTDRKVCAFLLYNEQYRQESTSRFKMSGMLPPLIRAISEGVILVDRDGLILDANPRAEEIFGYEPGKLVGLPLDALVPEKVRAQHAAFVTAFFRDPRFRQMDSRLELSCLRKDGTEFPSEIGLGHLELDGDQLAVAIITDISARRQAEQALRDSEARYQALFNNVPVGLYRTKSTGEIVDANPSLATMLGFPDPAELLATNATQFYVNPQDRDRQRQTVEKGGLIIDYEMPLRRLDGSIIWVIQSVRAVRDEGGEVLFYEGALRDISPRKQAEAAVSEQRTLTEALQKGIAALNHSLDLNEVLDSILEGIGQVVAYDAANIMLIEEDVTRTVRTRGFAERGLEDWQLAQRYVVSERPALRQMAETGQPVIFAELADSLPIALAVPERFLELHSYLGAPILLGDQVIGFINLNSEQPDFYTEQQGESLLIFANQAAIAVQNAQLYEMAQRRTRYLTSLNQASARTTRMSLGLSRVLQDIVDTLVDQLGLSYARIWLADEGLESLTLGAEAGPYPPMGQFADLIKLVDYPYKMRQVIQTRRPWLSNHIQEEEGFDHDWAREHDLVAFAAYPLFDNDDLLAVLKVYNSRPMNPIMLDVLGSFVAHAGAMIYNARLYQELDLHSHHLEQAVEERTAELRQANESLKHLDHMKDVFLSTAAHELRTPLTSIRAFSELLLMRGFEDERRLRYLTMIKEQSQQLADIVEDLLNISQLEARGDLTFNFKEVHLSALVDEALQPFIATAGQHHFVQNGLDDLPVVQADSFRLGQVLTNLLSNAVKYSPDGGQVTIEGRCIADHLEIHVTDQGIGLAPDDQQHLFERFYRATDIAGGTGLGLAICKLIVERHNGRIWVESEEGKGSTFIFSLPLVRQGAA